MRWASRGKRLVNEGVTLQRETGLAQNGRTYLPWMLDVRHSHLSTRCMRGAIAALCSQNLCVSQKGPGSAVSSPRYAPIPQRFHQPQLVQRDSAQISRGGPFVQFQNPTSPIHRRTTVSDMLPLRSNVATYSQMRQVVDIRMDVDGRSETSQ